MFSARISCYVGPDGLADDQIFLSAEESRHLHSVMRVKQGDSVYALNGKGVVAECSVASADKRRLTLDVVSRKTIARPEPRLILVQAVLKTKAMDDVVQRATEVGVDSIYPVYCQRSIPKPGKEEAKQERWNKIAVSAIKQCSRAWLPEIANPMPLEGVCDMLKGFALCGGALTDNARPLSAWASTVEGQDAVALVIGPEGDFSKEEYTLLASKGVEAVWLGPHVMRADTAAISGLAQISGVLHRP